MHCSDYLLKPRKKQNAFCEVDIKQLWWASTEMLTAEQSPTLDNTWFPLIKDQYPCCWKAFCVIRKQEASTLYTDAESCDVKDYGMDIIQIAGLTACWRGWNSWKGYFYANDCIVRFVFAPVIGQSIFSEYWRTGVEFNFLVLVVLSKLKNKTPTGSIWRWQGARPWEVVFTVSKGRISFS